MHDSSSKLEVVMGLDMLFGDSLNIMHEKQPDAPTRSLEADTRTFTNGTCIEAIVDQVFQVFHYSDLSHEFVLVTVHAIRIVKGRQWKVWKNILRGICELKGVD